MRERQRRHQDTATRDHAVRRSPHADLRSARRPSIQLISDAVVAGYLHDISQRHRNGDSASGGRLRRPTHR